MSVSITVHRANLGSWTRTKLRDYTNAPKALRQIFSEVEKLAAKTEAAGALPLWRGYAELDDYPTETGSGATRSSREVRTARKIGEFYAWVVTSAKPAEIVEVGGAFGVSGMYYSAGLRYNGTGNLTSFEPNEVWAGYAAKNVAEIWERSRFIVGTFEDCQDALPESIDLAFIDAIHLPEFVETQLALTLRRASAGALIFLDDINFSPRMRDYWQSLVGDPRFAASFEVTRRVGALELPR